MALLQSFLKHLVILAAFPLLTLLSTKPIKSASCALKGLSMLLDFTDLSDIPYKDLNVELLLFLHSLRTLALPLVFSLVQPLFVFCSLALTFPIPPLS